MPQTALIVDEMNRSGQVPTAQVSDEVNGNSVTISGKEFLRVTNTDAAPHDITVTDSRGDVRGLFQPKTVTIAATATIYLGPYPKYQWADGASNLILSYSAGTAALMDIEVVRNPDGSPQDETEV